mmetsp:Transcript_61541/g.198143  ORF Transcript_61541/g.198143 Transcript_61541/m.198143 type:complete len:260 (+) Transcript_61541:718-1497(+)
MLRRQRAITNAADRQQVGTSSCVASHSNGFGGHGTPASDGARSGRVPRRRAGSQVRNGSDAGCHHSPQRSGRGGHGSSRPALRCRGASSAGGAIKLAVQPTTEPHAAVTEHVELRAAIYSAEPAATAAPPLPRQQPRGAAAVAVDISWSRGCGRAAPRRRHVAARLDRSRRWDRCACGSRAEGGSKPFSDRAAGPCTVAAAAGGSSGHGRRLCRAGRRCGWRLQQGAFASCAIVNRGSGDRFTDRAHGDAKGHANGLGP